MNNRIILTLFLLLSFFCQSAFSDAKKQDLIWTFDKVSDVDIFGKHDANAISDISNIYRNVTINVGEKTLDINNDFLEAAHVCSIDYVNIAKTPLSYFLSQKTVNMYEKLFAHEGIPFAKRVSILESVFPDRSCPPPYDELIKNDNHLMVLEQNHVIFFKEMKADLNADLAISEKESLSMYCHNEKAEHAYDGTSGSICDFRNMNLKQTYEKIRVLNDFSRKYMKEDLPIKNDEYKINEGAVSYQWNGNNSLNIFIVLDGESSKYSFNEQSSGTKLEISGVAEY